MNCKIEGCLKARRKMEMCEMHYMRQHVHGDPLYSYDNPEEVSKRFWKRVDKAPGFGPWKNCWLYAGRLDKDGYGLNTSSQYKYERRAHRFAYVESNGPILADLVLRHRCDVRACVNPDHLIPGTNLDNVRDRTERGRSFKGMNNPRSKLTDDGVREIRRRIASGEKKARIAREFKVSDTVVHHIFIGRSWKHISGENNDRTSIGR